MNKNEMLFDKRTVEINLRQGVVTRADYQAWLKSLADRGKDAEWVDMETLANRSYIRGIRGADPEPK